MCFSFQGLDYCFDKKRTSADTKHMNTLTVLTQVPGEPVRTEAREAVDTVKACPVVHTRWAPALVVIWGRETAEIMEGGLALIRARVNGIFYRSCIVHGHLFLTVHRAQGLPYVVHSKFALTCTVHDDLYTRAHVHRPPQCGPLLSIIKTLTFNGN